MSTKYKYRNRTKEHKTPAKALEIAASMPPKARGIVNAG